MEAIVAQSLSYAKISKPLSSNSTSSSSSSSISPPFLQCKASFSGYQSAKNLGFKRVKLQCIGIINPISERKKIGVVYANEGGSSSVNVAQGWLLDPVGDGDWKHIGFKVTKPGALEIFSNEKLIIGRVPEKADLVIPVATVSGLHARIQNKEGNLFITDLDSTNGTYINEKRVPPGTTSVVPPGSLLTFGDSNLAIFRVSKIEKTLEVEEEEPEEESEEEVENEGVEMTAQS